MSKYLIHRIEASPRITLHPHTEITALFGDEELEAIELTDNRSGESRRADIRHAFVFIGATPNTGWLPPEIALDAKGFVRTSRDLEPGDLASRAWAVNRQPFLLETSVTGVFAAGDVRSSSTKRVASAVGEGSIAVSFIHQVLAE
jgi:thioredoxin reductase (NADPH)